jgi:hypothetical protein
VKYYGGELVFPVLIEVATLDLTPADLAWCD